MQIGHWVGRQTNRMGASGSGSRDSVGSAGSASSKLERPTQLGVAVGRVRKPDSCRPHSVARMVIAETLRVCLSLSVKSPTESQIRSTSQPRSAILYLVGATRGVSPETDVGLWPSRNWASSARVSAFLKVALAVQRQVFISKIFLESMESSVCRKLFSHSWICPGSIVHKIVLLPQLCCKTSFPLAQLLNYTIAGNFPRLLIRVPSWCVPICGQDHQPCELLDESIGRAFQKGRLCIESDILIQVPSCWRR